MATSYNEAIKQIKTAVYGEEVRNSIIDAIDFANESSAIFANFIGSVNWAKDIFATSNWKIYNGITVTTNNGYISFNGTKGGNAQTFLLNLSKTLTINASGTNLVLAKIRLKSVGHDTIVTFRDDAFFNSSCIVASNTEIMGVSMIKDTLKADAWQTIWVVCGNAERSISRLGIQPLDYTSDFEIQVQSVEIYDSTDSSSKNINDIIDIKNNITALQNTVDGNADTDGTIKNQIATAKTEIIEGNVNPLVERMTTAESDISGLQAYVGYVNDDVLGLQVDFENKRFTRLAGAAGLKPGKDFDRFEMFGGRKRCNVADDGTINAYYGDSGYKDDGSNGQVMVYQPAFYYKVVPVAYEKNKTSGTGYHLRKVNYYISARAHNGFKLHPAFFDSNGNKIDYILYSAYEGCLYSNHHYVNDNAETSAELDLTADIICSLAGRKPISGLYKPMTRTNLETLCQNHGTGWHLETIKSVAANQLLMIVEYATMNLQGAIGQGVVSIPDDDSYNCASLTGSTSALGNTTGEAAETVNEINGTKTTYTTSGKTAVSYRGIENPWGNMWRFVNGINVYGDGTMSGGQAYICDDLSFAEGNADNYKKSGFTLPPSNGFISAMGYGGDDYDWLLSASESGGTSILPVGDYAWVAANLNGYRACRFGGNWRNSGNAGPFCCYYNAGTNYYSREYGGRLLYVPTAVN